MPVEYDDVSHGRWARTHDCPWIKGQCDNIYRNQPETLAWVRAQL